VRKSSTEIGDAGAFEVECFMSGCLQSGCTLLYYLGIQKYSGINYNFIVTLMAAYWVQYTFFAI
jgi:hypothetical protein